MYATLSPRSTQNKERISASVSSQGRASPAAPQASRKERGGSSLSLTSYLVHTNVVDISTTRFDSFDPKEHNIINDIKHITLYAQKSNYHSIPTDCPTVRLPSDWLP